MHLDFLRAMNIDADEIIDGWLNHKPILIQIDESELGRNGLIIMPYIFEQELLNPTITTKDLLSLLRYAKSLGARAIYPRMYNLFKNFPERSYIDNKIVEEHLPFIVDEYPITAAALALSCNSVLYQNSRKLENEKLHILGLGYIGYGALTLLLRTQKHPLSITLCDLEGNKEKLFNIKKELKEIYKFKGTIDVVLVSGPIPAEFYAGSLYLCAVTMPNVLDVTQLPANTILCDSSSPTCFDMQAAQNRLKLKKDITYSLSRDLKLKDEIINWLYLPENVNKAHPSLFDQIAHRYSENAILPCTHMGLLQVNFPYLRPSSSLTIPDKVLLYYDFIKGKVDLPLP